MAGGTQAKQERNKCCSLESFESKRRICDIGDPFDTVKGIIMSVGVFRRTEKQSYSRAEVVWRLAASN